MHCFCRSIVSSTSQTRFVWLVRGLAIGSWYGGASIAGSFADWYCDASFLLGLDAKTIYHRAQRLRNFCFVIFGTWVFLLLVSSRLSPHRVHHASNLDYLDANYGGVLIIFDRLFGTYRPERLEEPCIYGLVKPMRTRNVLTMEFSQWADLYRDMRQAPNIRSALMLLIMPPGWSSDGNSLTTEALRAQQSQAHSTWLDSFL